MLILKILSPSPENNALFADNALITDDTKPELNEQKSSSKIQHEIGNICKKITYYCTFGLFYLEQQQYQESWNCIKSANKYIQQFAYLQAAYLVRKQHHPQKTSAISIQAFARGFIVQQQIITKHTAAVIIQTNFCLAYQQRIIYGYNDVFDDWNHHNDYNNEKKENEEHINDLFSSLLLDVDNINKTFGIIHHEVPDLLLSERFSFNQLIGV
eukprot:431117-Ditylum_brightwellii.AAC.1